MRHFGHLSSERTDALFLQPPQAFDRRAPVEVLAPVLGATLYMPATRPALAADLLRRGREGVVSAVACLEDAVPDVLLSAAQDNLVRQVRELSSAGAGQEADLPLLFVRVRSPEQLLAVVDAVGEAADVLSGFVLPKFTPVSGPAFLDAMGQARRSTGLPLLAMPVLESPVIVHRETRSEALAALHALLHEHRSSVAAIRIGATDLASAYGLRRDPDLTVWDVRVLADLIGDIVNVFGRADGSGFVVTGTVWEHFPSHDRLFKPQLRQSPFEQHRARPLRSRLISADLDALIREIVLDKANGMIGKTVIHPSHVPAVHALSVVMHEEFSDAVDVLGEGMASGGVAASTYRNKMNEAKPHRAWARRTLARAAAFGVAAADVGFVDLLAATSVTAPLLEARRG